MKKYKILMLLISLLLLAAVVVYSNPLVIADKLAGSNHLFLLGAFLLSLIAVGLGVLKWKILLKGVGYKELFPVQTLGYAVSNFTPGKAGEPAKAVILKMRSGTPISFSLPSIIWERVMDIIVLVLLSLIAIGSMSIGSGNLAGAIIISIGIFAAIAVVAFAVLFNRSFGNRVFVVVRKLPLLKRLPKNFMNLFYKHRVEKSRLIKAFFITLLDWFVIGASLYASLLAFGVSANIFVLSGIVALSIVVGIASSLPGGIGTTEIVMIFLLGLLGVESSTAAAATITFRLATIWFVDVLGGLSFLYLSRKFEIKNLFK